MTPDLLFKNFDLLSTSPNAIPKLRELILPLVIQGKMTKGDPKDQSAKDLLKSIEKGRNDILSKKKELPPIHEDGKVSVFPKNWCQVRLGDAVRMVNGRAFKPSEWSTRGLPIIRIQNLNNENAPFNHCDFDVDPKYRVAEGDLLLSWSGTPGTSFGAFIWERGPALLNQHIFNVFLLGDAFDKEFLRLAIDSKLNEMISHARGGVGLKHVTKGELDMLIVPLPPKQDQSRIVKKFYHLMGLCDELEEREERRKEMRVRVNGACLHHLTTAKDETAFSKHWRRVCDHFDLLYDTPKNVQELRQAILQLAVMGKLVKQDPKDEPAEVLLERIETERNKILSANGNRPSKKTTVIDLQNVPFPLPQNWKWVRLASLTEVITKGSSPKWQGIDYVDESNGILFITSENVGNHRLLLHKRKFVENRFNEIEPRSILRQNDILMNIVGASIGRTAVFNLSDVANINQAVCLIRCVGLGKLLDLSYLLQFFNSPLCISFMFDQQVENARANLSMGNIANFLVPLPPFQEQKRISNMIEGLFSLCDDLETKLNRSRSESEKLMEAVVGELVNVD